MAITFETFDIPKSADTVIISNEEITKIKKRVSKSDTNLKKEFEKISRKEHRAWKSSYNMIRN